MHINVCIVCGGSYSVQHVCSHFFRQLLFDLIEFQLNLKALFIEEDVLSKDWSSKSKFDEMNHECASIEQFYKDKKGKYRIIQQGRVLFHLYLCSMHHYFFLYIGLSMIGVLVQFRFPNRREINFTIIYDGRKGGVSIENPMLPLVMFAVYLFFICKNINIAIWISKD